ncbi:uncharacterized protein [Cebidichthys violaceus]|uniref:uncharacterized protein n=1 Tax=Cebidichthys violaceus TaxID=271503 RepID=UPI0035CAFCB8
MYGRTPWRCRLFHRLWPTAEHRLLRRSSLHNNSWRLTTRGEDSLQNSPARAPDGTAEEVDEVVGFNAPTEEEEEAAKKRADKENNKLPILTAFLVQAVCQKLANRVSVKTHHVRQSDVMHVISSQSLRGQQLDCVERCRCADGRTSPNLPLNLASGASVQQRLQDNLMETELDFRWYHCANTFGFCDSARMSETQPTSNCHPLT